MNYNSIYAFQLQEYCKERESQSVHRDNGFISNVLIFFVWDLYVNLILVGTWLTYNDYNHSAGVRQLMKNMCSGIIKSAY